MACSISIVNQPLWFTPSTLNRTETRVSDLRLHLLQSAKAVTYMDIGDILEYFLPLSTSLTLPRHQCGTSAEEDDKHNQAAWYTTPSTSCFHLKKQKRKELYCSNLNMLNRRHAEQVLLLQFHAKCATVRHTFARNLVFPPFINDNQFMRFTSLWWKEKQV